jgi:hypothetical protein
MMTVTIILFAFYAFLVWSMLRVGRCAQEDFYD